VDIVQPKCITNLHRFSDDGIDETPEVEALLRRRFPSTGRALVSLEVRHLGDFEISNCHWLP
jgi:hypothetical protein